MVRDVIKNVYWYIYWLGRQTSTAMVYNKNWKDEYSLESIKSSYAKVLKHIKEDMTKEVWESLTDEECDYLHFGNWSETSTLRLIPIELFEALPEGLTVIGFFGDRCVVGKDYIDNDIRCGCLAYGIYPKDKEVIEETPEYSREEVKDKLIDVINNSDNVVVL